MRKALPMLLVTLALMIPYQASAADLGGANAGATAAAAMRTENSHALNTVLPADGALQDQRGPRQGARQRQLDEVRKREQKRREKIREQRQKRREQIREQEQKWRERGRERRGGGLGREVRPRLLAPRRGARAPRALPYRHAPRPYAGGSDIAVSGEYAGDRVGVYVAYGRPAVRVGYAAPAPVPPPPPVIVQRRGPRHIPPGHLPPPGLCRIWYDDRPPGHQPPPTDCASAYRYAPPNSRIVYGG